MPICCLNICRAKAPGVYARTEHTTKGAVCLTLRLSSVGVWYALGVSRTLGFSLLYLRRSSRIVAVSLVSIC